MKGKNTITGPACFDPDVYLDYIEGTSLPELEKHLPSCKRCRFEVTRLRKALDGEEDPRLFFDEWGEEFEKRVKLRLHERKVQRTVAEREKKY